MCRRDVVTSFRSYFGWVLLPPLDAEMGSGQCLFLKALAKPLHWQKKSPLVSLWLQQEKEVCSRCTITGGICT